MQTANNANKDSLSVHRLQDNRKQARICPNCSFDLNLTEDVNCQICGHQLSMEQTDSMYPFTRSLKINNINNKTYTSKDKKTSRLNLQTKIIRLGLNLIKKNQLNNKIIDELKKPINIAGLVVIGIVIGLWANKLISSNKLVQEQEKKESIALIPNNDKPTSIQGLFNYGGAPYYAPLVSNGLNTDIETAYPGFELRFAKPLNQDYSNANGIRMLLDGELTVALSGRPLTDAEYKKAQLRDINLKQVPIAIDGVVFFGNNNLSVSQINLEQAKAIFEGKITNWNQINPNGQNLPIVPILLDNESLETIGIEPSRVSSTSQYVPNYTQALRKVIGTPGSLAFSSASLVKDQQLIQIFALADNNLFNYVPAFVDGNPNTIAFKSGEYPLTRRLFTVYRQDSSLADSKAGEVYTNHLLTEQGQQTVKKSGFVPIK